MTTTSRSPPPLGLGGSTDSGRRVRSDRALLVVDMVQPALAGAEALPAAASVLHYIRGELRYFRERERLILFAYTEAAPKPALLDELMPRADELVVWKRTPSAFFGTDLDTVLRERGVRRLTLVGVETCTAVLLTAADALARGYEVVVPEPCVTARAPDDHRFALKLMKDIWPQTMRPVSHG